jgi:hypothetical protein
VVPEVLQSFYVAGGQGDKRRLPDRGDRKATPPDHVAARVSSYISLTLGIPAKDSRPATTRDLMSSKWRSQQEKISSIFADGAPHGRLRGAKGGFPQRFPPSRRGPRSFTSFRNHTHHKWGSIVGRGKTVDRDRPGGRSYGISRFSTAGSTSTGTKTCAKDALRWRLWDIGGPANC